MRYISKSRSCYAIKSNKQLLLPVVFLLMISACVDNKTSQELDARSSKYSTESLAKDWREQVRTSPKNPYEGYNYPSDNDSEYMPPKKGGKKSPPGSNTLPTYDNDDSNYGKFPRYNPDDDNAPIDPKHYPLYFD